MKRWLLLPQESQREKEEVQASSMQHDEPSYKQLVCLGFPRDLGRFH